MKLRIAIGSLALAATGTGVGCSDSATTTTSDHENLTVVAALEPGDDCEAGGYTVSQGVDADGDGMLDASEVADTSVICNGVDGQRGATGAAGEKGDQGDRGAMGAQGDAGAAGEQGAPGEQGVQGATGAAGAQGATGAPGATGAQGDPGATGAQGPTGPTGPQGPTGPRGDAGAPGPQGPEGAPGPQGPNGDAGAEGPVGAAGPEGPEGSACSVTTTYIYATGTPVIRQSCTDGTTAVLNGQAQTPTAASDSSESAYWVAANAINSDQAGWMSGVDTGVPEWLMYDYGAGHQLLVTGVRGYIVNGRDGYPTFQGSNDLAEWTDLAVFDWNLFTFDGAPWQGYGSYAQAFAPETDAGYRYVRAYSAGAPYLYYSWLQFDGVMIQ